MPATGVYESVKSTPSITDELSAQVIESGWNIFVSGGNNERLNGALKVVGFSISHRFQISNHKKISKGAF